MDESRIWFKSQLGLPVSEVPRSRGFCHYAIERPGEVMVVPDALADRRFADHPIVVGELGIRFYAAAPLRSAGGAALGTLAVLDRRPRRLTAASRTRLTSLAEGVCSVLELHRANLHLMRAATHDGLTGLANRAHLLQRLERALSRGTGEAAVVAIDLDRFKAVNDTRGHAAGDAVLRAVADRLRAEVRGGIDLVARLGGDEFVILVPAPPSSRAVASLADRVLASLARPVAFEGGSLCVGASVGVALAPADAQDPDALLRAADAALYAAKRSGRGRSAFAVSRRAA